MLSCHSLLHRIHLFGREVFIRFAFVMTLTTGGPVLELSADDDPDSPEKPVEVQIERPAELTPEAQQVADELRDMLPADSEARAMLDAIVNGSRLGPGEGWFEMAVSQTRYPWDRVSQLYDANSNGRINLKEFDGNREDFERLNQDSDRVITESDFDWSKHSLTPSPGLMLFYQADQDSNGKVTREEFSNLFTSLDVGLHGFLSLDELRNQFVTPSKRPQESQGQREKRADEPSPSQLVLALKRQEIGSLQPGPNVEDSAPNFSLKSLDGKEVNLAEEIGERPIVLIFGNFTCGPFRSQAGNIEKLYERYRDRAKFFLVYVREAHPSDGWWMASNQRAGIDLAQPTSQEERLTVAQHCQRHLQLSIPFLVDSTEDVVGTRYSGMPNRMYLIDNDGKIAFKNGRGPFGFHPRELEQALILLLNQTESNAVE